jgi:hypothetical protein
MGRAHRCGRASREKMATPNCPTGVSAMPWHRRLLRHRFRRCMVSASSVFFGGLAAMIALFVAATRPDVSSHVVTTLSWVFVIVFLGLAFLQWRSEYRRRTYDSAFAIKYSDEFSGPDMNASRHSAAKQLKASRDKLAEAELPELDEIFDFFEDLGFYTNGDQVSAEVVHHTFYYWIRGYCSAAGDYIEAKRKKAGESARWEYVRILFELTSEVEARRTKNRAGREHCA